MKKEDVISNRIWKDTGRRVDGKRLYISVLGHYALVLDGRNLIGLTRVQMAKGGIDVNKSGC